MNKETYYRVIYHVKGLKGSPYENIEGLEKAMESELMRVYNIYANKANDGVTEKLNEEFDRLYPTYHEDAKDKEWYEKTEYNKFISDGYQRLVVNDLNRSNISPILNFYVDPEEVVFTGYLKVDRNITIDFSMKEV